MDRFIAKHNVEHFKSLLATELDEARSQCIRRLLVEEEAKLRLIEEKQNEGHFSRPKGREVNDFSFVQFAVEKR